MSDALKLLRDLIDKESAKTERELQLLPEGQFKQIAMSEFDEVKKLTRRNQRKAKADVTPRNNT